MDCLVPAGPAMSQEPQHSKMRARCNNCFARQSICYVVSHDSSLSWTVIHRSPRRWRLNDIAVRQSVWASHSTFHFALSDLRDQKAIKIDLHVHPLFTVVGSSLPTPVFFFFFPFLANAAEVVSGGLEIKRNKQRVAAKLQVDCRRR